ncbi:MAG: phospholipase D-like domain-containing protein [Acinetobacter junii]|nr:phospholipase D-like domain-containing protein [Acinetobacter junii]
MKAQPAKNNHYLVAIPFGYSISDVTLRKSSQWSVLDLIVIRRIARERVTLDDLVAESNLNRQLLIQIILPFIKLDWITLVQDENKIYLQITAYGLRVADLKSLPQSPKKINTKREFIVNFTNGDHIGLLNNNINLYSYTQVKEFERTYDNFIFLDDISNNHFKIIDVNKAEKCIIKDDEEIVTYIPPVNLFLTTSDYKYVVFNINVVKGVVHSSFKTKFDNEQSENSKGIFSATSLKQISNHIAERLHAKSKASVRKVNSSYTPLDLEPSYEFNILRENIELILGSTKHLENFKSAFNDSKSYVIIHSTFIGKWNFNFTIDSIISALKRGVIVYLLWGKDQMIEDDSNFDAIKEYFEKIENDYYGLFYLHKIQTGSHAKFIIFDTQESDCISIIGSCNWFYTNFDRYEGSVLIKDNDFAKKLLNLAASIATGRSYLSNELTKKLSRLSNQIPPSKSLEGHEDDQIAKVNLLLKYDHYKVLNLAQRAKERIYILSDKISFNINRAVWAGLKHSKAQKIKAWYTSDSEQLTHDQIQRFSQTLKNEVNEKINLKHDTSRKRNHSKILAWDKNHIVITSLNWLSANSLSTQANDFDNNHEIGVYINHPKIEQEFVQHFNGS